MPRKVQFLKRTKIISLENLLQACEVENSGKLAIMVIIQPVYSLVRKYGKNLFGIIKRGFLVAFSTLLS